MTKPVAIYRSCARQWCVIFCKQTDQTMDCPLYWRHVSTCYRVICAYCAYVTIPRTLGDTPPFCKQGLSATVFGRKQTRSNQNLPSRWVLAWSVQKWILWVIIERWEAFGPSTLRDCRQLHKTPWSLEAARFVFKIVPSLWNLRGTSAAVPPRRLCQSFQNDAKT